MSLTIPPNSTDQSVYVHLADSSDGTDETGFAHGDLTVSYQRDNGSKVSVTMNGTHSALNDAHSDGYVFHAGGGNYRIDLPDAAFASGASQLRVYVSATGAVQTRGAETIRLLDVSTFDASTDEVDADVVKISGDATAADNLEAAADGTGYNLGNGSIVAASVTGGINTAAGTITTLDGLDTAQDTQHSTTQGRLPAALVSGRIDASVGAMAANTVTATSIASNAITSAKIASNAIGASQIASGALTAAKFAAGAFDAVWTVTTRLLTAGTNIVLAKGTGITGFNDPTAADVWSAGTRTLTAATNLGLPSNFGQLSIDASGRVDVGLIEGQDATNQIANNALLYQDVAANLPGSGQVSTLSSATVIQVYDATPFHVGSIIRCEGKNELMLISAVDLGTDQLTVTRGHGGTTQQDPEDDDVLYTVAINRNDVAAEVDAALADIHLDHLFAVDYDPASKPGVSTALLNELIESDGGVSRFTTNALEQGPSGGGGGSGSDITVEITDISAT